MSDGAMQAIRTLAGSMRDLERQAALQYLPVVDDILRTRSRDTRHIEHTLDGLLDFCGHEPVLRMYKNLPESCEGSTCRSAESSTTYAAATKRANATSPPTSVRTDDPLAGC